MTRQAIPPVDSIEGLRIEVLSRAVARRRYGILRGGRVCPQIPDDIGETAIISISEPGHLPGTDGWVFDRRSLLGVLYLEFDDIEEDSPSSGWLGGQGYRWMSDEQAQDAWGFVLDMLGDGMRHLVVHCGEGVSRSAGVAAAIGRALGLGDGFVFDDPRFSPNMTCYRKCMLAATGDAGPRG